MAKKIVNPNYMSAIVVVPIYSIPNLESVLYESKLIPKIFNDSEKVREYGKLFPISKAPIGQVGLHMDDMKKTCLCLLDNKQTNLDVFIKYCIEQAEKRRVER